MLYNVLRKSTSINNNVTSQMHLMKVVIIVFLLKRRDSIFYFKFQLIVDFTYLADHCDMLIGQLLFANNIVECEYSDVFYKRKSGY